MDAVKRTLVLAAAIAALPAAATAEGFLLRDVAREAGIDVEVVCGSHTRKYFIIEQLGGGGALFDYDGDGDLDLYVGTSGDLEMLRGEKEPVRNVLYRNDGDWRFVDTTDQAGVGDTSWGVGVAVADVDGDSDPDLYVTNWGENVLYLNQGDGTFRDASAASGTADPGYGASAAFGDVDHDGDMDLYVTNYLVFDLAKPPPQCPYEGVDTACGPVGLPRQADRFFRNEGGGRFTDASASSGVHEVSPEYGLGAVFGDYDDDGWVDLFVGNDSGANFLFHNLGGRRFEDEALLAGVATQAEGRTQAGMGVDMGDADGDGRLDIFITNFALDHNTLYRNQGDGLFEDVSHPSGLGGPSRVPMGWGTGFHDLDNDGDQDLYVANGHIYPEVDGRTRETYRQANQLYLNDGRGRFTDASERIVRRADGPQVSRGVAFGDIDDDGDVDLVVLEIGTRPTLLRNDGGSPGGAFLQLDLRDRAGTREGARAWVRAGGKIQRREATRGGSFCAASDSRLHFGLGSALRVERIEVRWPLGKRLVLEGLRVNRRYVVYEP